MVEIKCNSRSQIAIYEGGTFLISPREIAKIDIASL